MELCARALHWGVPAGHCVLCPQVPVPSVSDTETPEEKQRTPGELPLPPPDAGRAEH